MKKKIPSLTAIVGSAEFLKIPIATTGNLEVSLYFHIPFCTKKCPYCHFYVVPNREDLQKCLMEGLRKEWQSISAKLSNKKIVSIYFGGGTPALLAPRFFAEILSWIENRSVDVEITIEANPEELTLSLLEQFRRLGINRLSMGVQSLDDSSLHDLGRIHSAERAKAAILDAASAGFDNLSIDLMYDLPWQTSASWQRTLDALTDLPITHLSLYNLTIEPHTSFFKKKAQLEKVIPEPEASLQLLEMGLAAFEKIGLERYEISAFAKNGLYSRHNVGYWTGRPFLGLGPSAFSYWEGKRFRNCANLQRYRRSLLANESAIDFEEELTYPDNLHELLAVRLRLCDGASANNLPPETLTKLQDLEKKRLLLQKDARWKLTDRGMLFYDTVAEVLI
jgi:oxygen-independent coproporphyrinogen-3 oxidase